MSTWSSQIYSGEIRIVVTRAGRKKEWGACLTDTVSVWDDEKVLEIGNGDGRIIL
jgi:hypothetical protein